MTHIRGSHAPTAYRAARTTISFLFVSLSLVCAKIAGRSIVLIKKKETSFVAAVTRENRLWSWRGFAPPFPPSIPDGRPPPSMSFRPSAGGEKPVYTSFPLSALQADEYLINTAAHKQEGLVVQLTDKIHSISVKFLGCRFSLGFCLETPSWLCMSSRGAVLYRGLNHSVIPHTWIKQWLEIPN